LSNLRELQISERAYFIEKDAYSEDLGLLEFKPDPPTRFAYVTGPSLEEGKTLRMIEAPIERVSVDRIKAALGRISGGVKVGVVGECPECSVTAACIGNIDEDDELFLLLGEDALADIPNWHEPERLADHAYIVVAPREGAEGPETLPFDPLRVVRIEMPYVAVSSTDLRARARLGRSLRFFVPEAVATYIEENELYQG
jgi:nicotinate (nicotinamide) nucleotide adenylyltransferase